jgi:hypothetical protein
MVHDALLLVLVVVLVGGLFVRAWVWRVRGADLTVNGEGITTPLGRFSYRSQDKTLSFFPKLGPAREFELTEPARLVCWPHIEPSVLKELLWSLIGGAEFGLTDLLPRYRDHTKTIALVLESGSQRIVVAVLSQYRAVDMFDSLGKNDTLRAVLSGLRLYRDIDGLAEARAFEVQEALRRQGLSVE